MSDDLQFDTVEGAGPAACASCKTILSGEYFQANGSNVCATCASALRQALAGAGSAPGRFVRALLWGIGAALLGAGIYYGVLALTGYEVGLVSILVGFLVGAGVHRGSGGRGGLVYQCMAAIMTYLAIVGTYVPLFIKDKEFSKIDKSSETAFVEEAAVPVGQTSDELAGNPNAAGELPGPDLVGGLIALATLAGVILAAPFLAGFQNILGILIIGFGVWQAWKMNRRPNLTLSGPLTMTPPPPLPMNPA